jgi:hypothetical protein
VTPTRIEGMREADPLPSSKTFISSTRYVPKLYVIPSAETNLTPV